MMSMEDAVRGTLELMEAPPESINIRTSYNLHGCDFCPAELAEALKQKGLPLAMTYAPDHRQAIAANWPDSIDDREARNDWGWRAKYDLEGLVDHMMDGIRQPTTGA
jgi:nucleoside-diphosphate-sugar epimerase